MRTISKYSISLPWTSASSFVIHEMLLSLAVHWNSLLHDSVMRLLTVWPVALLNTFVSFTFQSACVMTMGVESEVFRCFGLEPTQKP